MTVFEPVKVDSCTSCGSTIKQFNPDSEMIICQHCGTDSSVGPTNNTTLQQNYSVPKNPLLKLHETFEYQSLTWQIIGCISYHGSVREWDSEDGVWENNPWHYNSWWVMNESRELAWIIHDSSGYKWSRKTTLKNNYLPENDRSYEKGSWEISSIAGEFSFFPTIGGSSITFEKNSNSIEILIDSEGNKKEIESFINSPIKPLHLFEAFNKVDLITALKRSKLARKLIMASALCLLIGYFFLSLRSETLLDIRTDVIHSSNYQNIIPLGEIGLDKKSLLQFKLNALLPQGDGSFDAELIIQDNDNRIVSEIPVSFWRTSGYDSDGSWVESARSISPYLNLPQSKNYRLSLKPSNLKRWKNISISGRINKNMSSSTPMIIGLILFGLLLFIQFVLQKNFIRKHTGLKV